MKNDKFREGFLYLVFGGLTTVLSLAMFWAFKAAGCTKTDLGYTTVNAICWFSAVTFAYFTNRTWVFNSEAQGKKKVFAEAVKFYGGRVFTGIFEILLPVPISYMCGKGISFEISGFEINLDEQWMSKFIVMAIIITMNYFVSKFFVFRKKKEKTQNSENTEADKKVE